MPKSRNGVVCLLGAGASVDAGYPTANDLLEKYKGELKRLDDGTAYIAPETNEEFTLSDIFNCLWLKYQSRSNSTPTYLENFFAHYDDPYNVGSVFVKEWGVRARDFEEQCLRKLRTIAIDTAYKELNSSGRETADYLQPLFLLKAPNSQTSAIATLNFDFTVEQQAHKNSYQLYDGFRKRESAKAPQEWRNKNLRNPLEMWKYISKVGEDFQGFMKFPKDHHLLLKLHGSIGWYALEEGPDWIGTTILQRHNPAYRYFRIPYQNFWNEKITSDNQILNEAPMRKAGAIWINPYIAYARAYKANPTALTLELLWKFSDLITKAETLITIGYSWSDAHINDLLLSGVAQGAQLIHIGLEELPFDILRLWKRKFRTTFDYLKHRLFIFGGRAKNCLGNSRITLPNGKTINLALTDSLNRGLPSQLSLDTTLPDINLDDPPKLAQQVIINKENMPKI